MSRRACFWMLVVITVVVMASVIENRVRPEGQHSFGYEQNK